jgi:xanthine dehydrogenase molybdenum-binding subunit
MAYEEYNIEDVGTGQDYPQSIYHNNATLKVVGDPTINRVDAAPKIQGMALFANDVRLPNLAYLAMKTCPYSNAKVTSVDTTAAKALDGVLAVYTHDDIPDLIARPPYHWVLQEECWEQGDEVAGVVAIDEDIAEEAVDLIDVTYEVRPFVLHAKEAAAADAPKIFGETNQVGSDWNMDRGDIDAGFAQADVTVGPWEYETVTKPHTGNRICADIENESSTSSWENDEEMVVWTSDQNSYGTARTIASQLNLPYNRVRGAPTFSGVGFGSKGSNNRSKILAAYASRELNRPVKCRRESEAQFSTSRSTQCGQHHTFRAGLTNDGTIVALEDINIVDSGAWGGRGSTDSSTVTQRYVGVPNLKLRGQDFATNTPGVGVPRCVHHPQASLALGPFLDMCAEEVDMDPADFLLKNVATWKGVGEDPDNPEWDIGTSPGKEMLEDLINRSGWKSKWKGWGTPVATNGSKKRGIGLGGGVCRHGYLSNPESAMIKAHSDGTFGASIGSRCTGQGTRTSLSIMVAEELGVPYESVTMPQVDTAIQQESRNPGGSTVTRGSGTAIMLAVRDLKIKMFRTAIDAGLIEANNPEDLETADSNIYLKADPSVNVPIKDVVARQNSVGGPLIGTGAFATKRQRWMHRQWNFGVVEVEVDTDTGEVEVLKNWVEHDAGRVIFYKGAISQAYGGSIMSLARGLYEALIKDEATGISLNPNYLDYKLPTYADVPDFDIHYNEAIDPFGPFGAKGIGEPLCHGPAIAIQNAIYNAIGGTRIASSTATPDKVLNSIGKA